MRGHLIWGTKEKVLGQSQHTLEGISCNLIRTLNVLGMDRKRRKLRRGASFIKGNLLEVGKTL